MSSQAAARGVRCHVIFARQSHIVRSDLLFLPFPVPSLFLRVPCGEVLPSLLVFVFDLPHKFLSSLCSSVLKVLGLAVEVFA